MTAEQSLAGAMGCASWRSYFRLREQAALTPVARVIRGGSSLRVKTAGALDVNEVGLTDLLLAAIWRFGPDAAAYAISSHAEAKHLGADIAIVHLATARILLYQAKLASLDGGVFKLKSPVTKAQITMLRRRRPVEILGTRFQMTGRLALYQRDLSPHLGHCFSALTLSMLREHLPIVLGSYPSGSGWAPEPAIGSEYYRVMLAGSGCSPSGVLAALVTGGADRLTSVSAASTWPWEFDVYQWLRRTDTGGEDQPDTAGQGFGAGPPVFDEYAPTRAEPQLVARVPIFGQGIPATEFTRLLAARLHLPATTKLYVITLP